MEQTFLTSGPHPRYQIIIDDEVKAQAAQAVAEGRTLDLKNDIVFKSFFSKACKESAFCRRKMLSAVIGRPVTDTTVLNPELMPSRTDGKFPRLDIHCKLEDGSEVDVEIQNSMYSDDQIKRSIYYAATLTHNALSSGESYSDLPHIYQIMFMNFKTVEDTRLHHSYSFKEREDHEELSDIVQIHYIELPKIEEILKNSGKELSEVEFWAMLIMAHESPEAQKLLAALTAQKEEMHMAQALLNTMSVDQQEWENQLGYERFVHDCISREKYAFSKGVTQGIYQAKLDTAKQLITMNLSLQQIAQATGLTVEEISALSAE